MREGFEPLRGRPGWACTASPAGGQLYCVALRADGWQVSATYEHGELSTWKAFNLWGKSLDYLDGIKGLDPEGLLRAVAKSIDETYPLAGDTDTDEPGWKRVASHEHGRTCRMRVRGGWLYRETHHTGTIALCFVPEEES